MLKQKKRRQKLSQLNEKSDFENCEKSKANNANVCANFFVKIFQLGFELQNLDVKSCEQALCFDRQRKMPEAELVEDV